MMKKCLDVIGILTFIVDLKIIQQLKLFKYNRFISKARWWWFYSERLNCHQ